jgi:uncharacterized coiled-coil protein SlyX
MLEKDLETSEIINQVKELNKVIKEKEVDKSQKEGKLGALFDRLKSETGKETQRDARILLKRKESKLNQNIARLRELYDKLREREEWKITMK